MTNGIIDSGQEIVTNGLVLHLDAGQRKSYSGTGTTWTDLSGNGNNGTLTNGPTFNPANGGSIQFDGVDDYAIKNTITSFNVGCISIWINSNTLINAASSFQSLIMLRWTGITNSEWYISLGSATGLLANEYITISDVTNGERTAIADGESLLPNTWYNLVFNSEQGKYKIYINGIKKTEITANNGVSQLTAPNTMVLGALVRNSIISGPFLGKISAIKLYDRTLTSNEILQNYNATKARFEVPALLNLYPNAAAAYSLRKLRSGYTGSAIRVRRSSDNTEQDIGFTSTGDLDTTALTTFVGVNNGFVTTWYDQSGTNNNATQATLDGQPLIVSSGVIVSENGKPSVYFNNGNTVYLTFTSVINTGTFTILWVSKKDNTTAQGSIVLSGSRNGNQYMGDDVDNQGNPTAFSGTSGGIIRTSMGNSSSSGNEILQHLSYLNRKNSTQAVGQYNNSTNSYNNNVTSTSAIIDSIAYYGLNYNYVGKIQEIIIYSLDKSENRQGISENINSYYGIYNPTVVTMDTDAQAFITAAGITDLIQQGAVDALVKDLKNYGLWTKMKAIYPFVGGTAASHKFNLKDPRDVDAAFRLVFFNTWTHNSNGVQGNSTNAYANTYVTPLLNLSLNSTHISTYVRNNVVTGGDIGCSNSSLANGLYINPRFTGDTEFSRNNSGSPTPAGVSNTNSIGFWLNSRVNSNTFTVYRNNIIWQTRTSNSTGLSNNVIYLGALNLAGSIEYSSRQIAFATIGDGLTDTEAANLYTAVQKYQTTLGRQV